MDKEIDNIVSNVDQNIPTEKSNAQVDKGEKKEKGEKGVTLSKEAFDALMSRIAGLEKAQKEIESSQDQDVISKLDKLRASGKLVKDVKVRKLGDKFVMGWKLVKDEVSFDGHKLIEVQDVEVYMEDGSKKVLPMRQWAIFPTYETMEVKRESRDENGDILYTVLGNDGKEIEINIKYLN